MYGFDDERDEVLRRSGAAALPGAITQASSPPPASPPTPRTTTATCSSPATRSTGAGWRSRSPRPAGLGPRPRPHGDHRQRGRALEWRSHPVGRIRRRRRGTVRRAARDRPASWTPPRRGCAGATTPRWWTDLRRGRHGARRDRVHADWLPRAGDAFARPESRPRRPGWWSGWPITGARCGSSSPTPGPTPRRRQGARGQGRGAADRPGPSPRSPRTGRLVLRGQTAHHTESHCPRVLHDLPVHVGALADVGMVAPRESSLLTSRPPCCNRSD